MRGRAEVWAAEVRTAGVRRTGCREGTRARTRPPRIALAVSLAGALAAVLAATACQESADLAVPTAEEVQATYRYAGEWMAEMSGNVAVLSIRRTEQEVRREGSTWAKAGPYIFLFSPDTQRLFQTYPGLAAVRAITVTPAGDTIAQALMPRDTLSALRWQRALNVAALARRDGTEEPRRMVELVRWGEDHTRHEYNPRFIR